MPMEHALFCSTTLSVSSRFSIATSLEGVLAAFGRGEEDELTLQSFDGSPDWLDAADARMHTMDWSDAHKRKETGQSCSHVAVLGQLSAVVGPGRNDG